MSSVNLLSVEPVRTEPYKGRNSVAGIREILQGFQLLFIIFVIIFPEDPVPSQLYY